MNLVITSMKIKRGNTVAVALFDYATLNKIFPRRFINTHQTESFLFWSFDVITYIIDDQSEIIFHKSFNGIGTGNSDSIRCANWNVIYTVIFAAEHGNEVSDGVGDGS